MINNLGYADDTVIIAESKNQLQQLMDTVVEESEEKGLFLNSAKSFTLSSKMLNTLEATEMWFVVPKKDAKDLIYGTCHKCRGPSQSKYKEEADK